VLGNLTFAARQLIIVARKEARALGRDYIGTEHLLLAILRDPNPIVARALGGWATVDQVRELARRTRSSEPVRRTYPDAEF
jgi:ATP-dependent Clp protease ATP-binding subunit ClpC